jgi:hypothetical protein
MQKWEYKIVSRDISEAELNNLGDQGWELIGFDTIYNAYLKRPKT